MTLISNAERALARNWRVVLLYIVLCAAAVAVYRGITNSFEAAVPEELHPKPFWFVAATLCTEIALAFIAALLQSITFARLGADIDRPLWKCASDREAVMRFCKLWFIINLLASAILQLHALCSAQDMAAAASALFLVYLVWNCAYIPVGICLMHNGGLKQLDVPAALAPLVHLFPQALLAASLGIVQFFLMVLMFGMVPESLDKSPYVLAVINIPLTLLECLAAAMVWIICVQGRDVAAERRDDDDFDF